MGRATPKTPLLAARSALAATHHGQPRVDGPREALRTLLVVRASAITVRTDAINQLKSLILQAPDALRDRLRSLTSTAQITACRRLRVPAAPPRSTLKSTPCLVLDDAEHRARVAGLRRLANRISTLTAEVHDAETELADLTRALAPGLLAEIGIGPITAAQILVSWSHPKRLRNEAAFAALAGVSPLDASSGRQQRHRLNRNGDRALNRALHTICSHQRTLPSGDQGVRGPPSRPRQHPPRSPPDGQALPRTTHLPSPRSRRRAACRAGIERPARRLTNIGAS